MHSHVGAVRDGGSRGLLAPVLQREETEVGEVGDVDPLLRADPEYPAHVSSPSPLPKLDESRRETAGTGLRTRSSLRRRDRAARSRRGAGARVTGAPASHATTGSQRSGSGARPTKKRPI